MSDNDDELRKHFNAVRLARGRILKTGLGFGSFVNMALTKPEVEHIDVVEIDEEIIAHFGARFIDEPRVTIHHADAFEFPTGRKYWDLAWHDIYVQNNEGLATEHLKLMKRYIGVCGTQGAWGLPKVVKKAIQRKTDLHFFS